MDGEDNKAVELLRQQVIRLATNMEKMKLAEYVDLLHSPWRLLWVNFTSGIARGLGIAVGFALLGALLVIILRWLVELNLPLIGGFIAQIVIIVQEQLKAGRF
jgi:hypothetical protein